MKKIFIVIGVVLIGLIAIVGFRAMYHFKDSQYQVTQKLEPVALDQTSVVQRFSQAIQIPTISYDDRSHFDAAAFENFQQFLTRSFPLVSQQTTLTKIAGYSLVYELKGQNPQLKPALFMGHMDVVPIEEATLANWQQQPFSGKVEDGVIWGRGTIDDKVSVVALMEAMELLLAQGIQPQRSIYFAFGHDEEAGGEGAKAIADYFANQHVQFEFVLDEGGVITQDIIPGVKQARN